MAIQLSQEFALEHCCCCGVAFAIPASMQKRLRETHQSFYCPNGHGQSYIAETEAERLRKQLAHEQKRYADEMATQGAELARVKREAARIAKRISAGVCPCCNRTFQDLARHMQSKHKGYALPPTKEQKQITGTVR